MLEVKEVPKPTPRADEVLIEVRAVSLNASDTESLTGSPAHARVFGLFRPKFPVLGTDVAGRVVAVGSRVTKFRPGDEVFGDILGRNGGLAEFACAPEKLMTGKPASMAFEEAAAFPQAGLVALQGIRDKGKVQSGHKVLIVGGGGGSGSFAVQLAKHRGAEVTGVDSGLKLDLMRSLGADHVIDYARQDVAGSGNRYDLILDLVASHSIFENRAMLTATGRYLVVGGPVPRILSALTMGPLLSLGKKKLGVLMVRPNKGLQDLTTLFEAGKVKPVIDRIYTLDEAREAVTHVLEGRALGKVVVTVASP